MARVRPVFLFAVFLGLFVITIFGPDQAASYASVMVRFAHEGHGVVFRSGEKPAEEGETAQAREAEPRGNSQPSMVFVILTLVLLIILCIGGLVLTGQAVWGLCHPPNPYRRR